MRFDPKLVEDFNGVWFNFCVGLGLIQKLVSIFFSFFNVCVCYQETLSISNNLNIRGIGKKKVIVIGKVTIIFYDLGNHSNHSNKVNTLKHEISIQILFCTNWYFPQFKT